MPSSCNSCSTYDDASPPERAPRSKKGPLALLTLPLRALSQLVVLVLLALIRGYQVAISPLLRPCCRFVPSCSEYARLALKKHGLVKGLGKSLYRLARCQPFCKGGYDAP